MKPSRVFVYAQKDKSHGWWGPEKDACDASDHFGLENTPPCFIQAQQKHFLDSGFPYPQCDIGNKLGFSPGWQSVAW